MTDSLNPYAHLYASPSGPGDQRPTALQIVVDNDRVDKLTDKVALITGATAGIGIETARALYVTGARVFITARNAAKAARVVKDIVKNSKGNGKIEVIEMDMESLGSVKEAARAFLGKSDRLNILINNAGKNSPSDADLEDTGTDD